MRTWIRNLWLTLQATSKGTRTRRPANRQRSKYYPCVERLEDRLTPSTATSIWSGAAKTPNWFDPANFAHQVNPTAPASPLGSNWDNQPGPNLASYDQSSISSMNTGT